SGEPGLTFRKATALVLTTLFGAYVGLRFSLSELLRLLAVMCGFVAVSSLIFGVLQLGTPVDNTPGWFGIFVQKNSLGRMMAFSVLVFLLASRIKWSNANPLKAGLVLCIVLLALSRSMTGVAAAVLIILFIILAPVLRNRLWRLIVSLAGLSLAGTAIITWVLSNLQLVSDLIGRSVTLTGRLELWAVCFYMALRQPWLGYGYSAFWLGLNGPSRIVWQIIRWHPPHPHNGLLSVWLDLGLIGAALVTTAYFVCVTKAVKFYRRTISPEAIWPLTYLVFFLLANLTESSVLTANGIFGMLCVARAISRGRRERRRTAGVAKWETLP